MDPLVCWRSICAAMAEGRVEDALWQMDDLQAWLKRGGFRPDGVPFWGEIVGSRRFLEAVVREHNLHVG